MTILDNIKSMNPFKKSGFDLDKELMSITQDSNADQNTMQDQFANNQNQNTFGNEGQQFQEQEFSNQNSSMPQDPFASTQSADPFASVGQQMPTQPMQQQQPPGQPLFQEMPVQENPVQEQYNNYQNNQSQEQQQQFDPSKEFQMLKSAPLPEQNHSTIRMQKELEVMQAKLDTLKAVLDSINQRLANMEEQNRYKKNSW